MHTHMQLPAIFCGNLAADLAYLVFKNVKERGAGVPTASCLTNSLLVMITVLFLFNFFSFTKKQGLPITPLLSTCSTLPASDPR